MSEVLDVEDLFASKVFTLGKMKERLPKSTYKEVTSVYESYLKAREYAVSKGATHYLSKDLSRKGNNWKTT